MAFKAVLQDENCSEEAQMWGISEEGILLKGNGVVVNSICSIVIHSEKVYGKRAVAPIGKRALQGPIPFSHHISPRRQRQFLVGSFTHKRLNVVLESDVEIDRSTESTLS